MREEERGVKDTRNAGGRARRGARRSDSSFRADRSRKEAMQLSLPSSMDRQGSSLELMWSRRTQRHPHQQHVVPIPPPLTSAD